MTLVNADVLSAASRPRVRSAPPATWRRWPTCRPCCSASARCAGAAARSRRCEGLEGGRPEADGPRRQGRPGAAQRHAGLDGARRRRPVRGRGRVRAPRSSPARCRSMPRPAATRRSIRASTPCAASPARSRWRRRCRRCWAAAQIRKSHIDCDRVQDPYSLRCQPQVMGAALDMLRFAAGVIEREANAVSDNPLVFADQGEILSGGNFHAEPVAMAADTIAIAHRRDRRAGRAPHRHADRRDDEQPAGLPGRRSPASIPAS